MQMYSYVSLKTILEQLADKIVTLMTSSFQ